MAWISSRLYVQFSEIVSNVFLVSGLALWGIGLAIHLFSTMLHNNLKAQDAEASENLGRIEI
jgi:hypothetical protein